MLKIQNMMDIKEVLFLWFIKILIKKLGLLIGVNNKIKQNQELDEEVHKPIIKCFLKNGFFLHLIFRVLFL